MYKGLHELYTVHVLVYTLKTHCSVVGTHTIKALFSGYLPNLFLLGVCWSDPQDVRIGHGKKICIAIPLTYLEPIIEHLIILIVLQI